MTVKHETDNSVLLHLLNHTQTLAGVLDPDGAVVYANASPLAASGLTLDDVVGEKVWNCPWWTGDRRALIQSDCVSARAGITTFREIQFISLDGLHWIELNATPVLNDLGEVSYIVLEGRSIEERKQAELSLKASQKEYKSFFEDVDVAFSLLSETGYVKFNAAAVKMLGYSDEKSLLGLMPDKFSPAQQPDGRESFEKAAEMITHAFKKGTHHFEWTLLKSDGKPIDIDVITTPVSFAGKKLLHCFWRDLTEVKEQQAALMESELRYRSQFENSSDALVLFADGKFLDVNDAAVNLLGYDSRDQLLNITPDVVSSSVQPDGRASEIVMAEVLGICYAKGSHRFEWLYRKKNGELMLAEILTTHMVVGDTVMLYSVIRDITIIKRQQQALIDSELKYKSLFEGSADATLLYSDERFIDCNSAALMMLGYVSKQEMLRVHPAELSPLTQDDGMNSAEKVDEMVQIAFAKGSNRFEWKHKRKNGEVFPAEVLLTALSVADKQILHVVWRDITLMKKQQQTLQDLAHYDILTGLPNRALFVDRFDIAIAHARRNETQLAICFLDLDNFKPVNDDHGHAVGDEVLKQVAQRISITIRDEDTVSRQGGDEFTMLLGNLSSYQQCEKLIKRILAALAEPFIIGEHEHTISASCGITLYPADDKDVDTLVRHADHAMYDAKISGKNTLAFFDANTEQLSQEQKTFLGLISRAIENDEFVLFYQPKINMRTGKMFGSEALVRWQHPEEGLVPPYEFLPTVENTPVMIDLGNWVIEAALIQLEKWCKEGKKWVLSINISAYHFMQEGFHKDLKQALQRHPEVPAELFEIEILETIAFDNVAEVAELIHQCQTLGVNFALDDFGTGSSSLTYLKNFPAQWLKIDQTFVRDMLEDEEDYALIEGIISLANAFKRDVIAEGVETIEQGTALMALGCYNAQGYVIAKPMPAENIIDWENNYQPEEAWSDPANISLTKNET